jgi:hypothetical protein
VASLPGCTGLDPLGQEPVAQHGELRGAVTADNGVLPGEQGIDACSTRRRSSSTPASASTARVRDGIADSLHAATSPVAVENLHLLPGQLADAELLDGPALARSADRRPRVPLRFAR